MITNYTEKYLNIFFRIVFKELLGICYTHLILNYRAIKYLHYQEGYFSTYIFYGQFKLGRF